MIRSLLRWFSIVFVALVLLTGALAANAHANTGMPLSEVTREIQR